MIDSCSLPAPDAPRRPALLPDADIGWLVGLYLAEGSRSEKVVQIAGHVGETARHARLARIAEALDGTCNVYRTSENGSTCNLSGYVILGAIDRYVSQGAALTKRLTLAAWQRSNEFLAAVMEGYLDGDGHYDAKNDRWRLGFTRNDDWAADLRTLAARLGARLALKRGTAWGFEKQWDIWRGEWRWASAPHWNAKAKSEIVAIRASRARQFFDVGVADEPHLFALASGVLTHNSKPNGMPESAQDRVRAAHEYVFHLTKQGDYYAALDAVREPSSYERRGSVWTMATEPLITPDYVVLARADELTPSVWLKDDRQAWAWAEAAGVLSSPWPRPTGDAEGPFLVAAPEHFAAFPSELPTKAILGWSPSGICSRCGEGRRPVAEKHREHAWVRQTAGGRHRSGDGNPGEGAGQAVVNRTTAVIVGEACACPEPDAPTAPAVVLDVFGGTGTTAITAAALGRNGISLDLSADYTRLAHWRANLSGLDDKVRARNGLGVAKVRKAAGPADPSQVSLFD